MTAETPVRFLAERIEHVPIDSIEPHPDNPNEGDVGAIEESVDAVGGFYNVIFVQQSSGRIIAGEHRWRTLQQRGSPTAPVVYLDVDDATALRIMIGDNEIPRRRSRPDERALAELLTDLAQQTSEGLAGTGFDGQALDDLVAFVAGPPDLDELARNLGAPEMSDFWPVVRLVVPAPLRDRWEAATKHLGSDSEKLEFVLGAVDASG